MINRKKWKLTLNNLPSVTQLVGMGSLDSILIWFQSLYLIFYHIYLHTHTPHTVCLSSLSCQIVTWFRLPHCLTVLSLSDLLNSIFIWSHFKTFPKPDPVVLETLHFVWEMFFLLLTEPLKLYHPQKAFPAYLVFSLGLQYTQLPFHLYLISVFLLLPSKFTNLLFSFGQNF